MRVPGHPTAHVLVTTPDGVTVVDRVVAPGQDLALPSGDTLRITGVSYYARLQVVDDWTILLLYAVLAVAVIGLAVTVLARQQIVLATVIEGPDGATVAMRVSLWRNASSTRDEIETELGQALTGAGRGSTT
jgi:cytochrome c biogenesis protein ResB